MLIDRTSDVAPGGLDSGIIYYDPPWPDHTSYPFYQPYSDFVGTYEMKSDGPSSRRDWNSFSHYKRVANLNRNVEKELVFPITDYDEHLHPGEGYKLHRWYARGLPTGRWNYQYFGPPEAPLAGLAPLVYSDDTGILVPAPRDLDNLLDDAAVRILPGIRPKLSLLNSLYELKDFKSLGHTASNLANTGKQILNLLKPNQVKIGKNVASLTGREILRRQSDSYLQYKFNIAPLLSDIKGVFDSFKAYQAQAMRLVSQSAKLKTSHYTMQLLEDSDQLYNGNQDDSSLARVCSLIPGAAFYTSVSHRDSILLPSKFHVEIQYSYYYTEFQKQHAALFAALDDLGVNFNPAIIWNAIPWSFVVDWAFGVGQALQKYRTNNLEPVIDIHRCLWSIRRERHIICSNDVGTQTGIPMSFVKETAYRRQPYQMTGHSVQLSGLTPTEISLGAALGLTRRPRH